jgi:hypothetical protein
MNDQLKAVKRPKWDKRDFRDKNQDNFKMHIISILRTSKEVPRGKNREKCVIFEHRVKITSPSIAQFAEAKFVAFVPWKYQPQSSP